MNIKDLFKNLLKKGFRIGVGTGKPFDPHNQKRSDGITDIIKSDNKKRRKKNGIR